MLWLEVVFTGIAVGRVVCSLEVAFIGGCSWERCLQFGGGFHWRLRLGELFVVWRWFSLEVAVGRVVCSLEEVFIGGCSWESCLQFGGGFHWRLQLGEVFAVWRRFSLEVAVGRVVCGLEVVFIGGCGWRWFSCFDVRRTSIFS